jgi:hypothetical protein
MKKNGKLFDMLRKAFHHEKISVSRKTNSEYVEVNEPQLCHCIIREHLNKSLISFHLLKMVCLVGSFMFLNRCGMVRSFAKKGNPVNLTILQHSQKRF